MQAFSVIMRNVIEPLTSLAFSVYSSPGVYAVLVGSGLSRAASIPTGWEIVEDLTRKLAAVEGQDISDDVELGTESDLTPRRIIQRC